MRLSNAVVVLVAIAIIIWGFVYTIQPVAMLILVWVGGGACVWVYRNDPKIRGAFRK